MLVKPRDVCFLAVAASRGWSSEVELKSLLKTGGLGCWWQSQQPFEILPSKVTPTPP